MNWYKTAKINDFFLGVSIPVIATLLGMTVVEVANQIETSPQEIASKIQQTIQQKDIQNNENPLDEEDSQSNISNTQYFDLGSVAKMIENHEGKRNKIYYDTREVPTIGIGFNLQRNDARAKLHNLGVEIEDVFNREPISDKVVYTLFRTDLSNAIQIAQSFLPNFEDHPTQVQEILIDMSFNLGGRIFGFSKMRTALLNKDYQTAAEEMIDSKWYDQVGNRSKYLVNLMQNQ